MRQPFVGVRTQPVVDMKRDDEQSERRSDFQGRVKQCGRIAPAAVCDRDGARRRRTFSAPWCR